MGPLLIFALGVAPGIVWLRFFRRRDGYRPTPTRMLAITFVLGMLSTIPAGILSLVVIDVGSFDPDAVELGSVAAVMLLIVGPVEEVCKFLAVRIYAFRSSYFDEPSDGLILAAAASLGFASLENVLYITFYGPEVMLVRAPLSTLGHVIFASFWGEALGRRVHADSASPFWPTLGLPVGLALAATTHGMFNVAVTVAPWASLLFIGFGLWWVLRRLGRARVMSPFRLRRNYPQTACPRCGRRISVFARFCSGCGSALAIPDDGPFWCASCGSPSRPDAAFCSSCGDRFERR